MSLADIYGTRTPAGNQPPRPTAPLPPAHGGTSLADIYGTSRPSSSPAPSRPSSSRRTIVAKTSGIDYSQPIKPRTQAPAKHKRSILGQLKDAAFGIPAGVAHLGGESLQTLANITGDYGHRIARDVTKGSPTASLDVVGIPSLWKASVATGQAITDPSRVTPEQAAYAPLGAEVGTSLNKTGMDLRHPSRYRTAYQNGELVGTILNDAGNVAIVGGPLAKGLTGLADAADAAGLARTSAALDAAGQGVGRVAHLGGVTADTPISLPRAAIRRASEAVSPFLEDKVIPGLVEHNPQLFSREGRQMRREAMTGGENPMVGIAKSDRDKASIVREYKRAQTAAQLTPDEEAAIISTYRGGAHNIARLADQTGLDVETIRQIVTPKELPEHYLTPDAAAMAADLVRERTTPGTASPELVAKESMIHGALDRQANIDQSRALNGYGRTGGVPLSHEQLGTAVLTSSLPEIAGHLGKKVKDLTQADLDAVTDPAAYPAKWRPRMVENERVHRALTEHYLAAMNSSAPAAFVPPQFRQQLARQFADQAAPLLRPDQMLADGVDAHYLPQGESVLVQPRGAKLRQRMSNEGAALSGDMTLRNEHIRSGQSAEPHSLRTLADLQMRDRGQAVLNETNRELIANHGTQVVSSYNRNGTLIAQGHLEPAEWHQIQQDATARAVKENPRGSAHEVRRAARAYAGEALMNQMAEKGYEPWPETGPIGAAPTAGSINPETPFLPSGMRQRLAPYWTPKPPPAVLAGIGKLNAKFKAAVLAPSLRWQIGDAVSNMMMAGLAGWTGPGTMLRRIGDVKMLSKDADMARLLDQGIAENSLFHDEVQWQRGVDPQAHQRRDLPVLGTKRPLKAAMGASFKLNEVVNRFQRQAFYLNELERNLGKEGIDLSSASHTIDDPRVQKAIAKAVDQTSFVLGDMSNLTPLERNYVKQVFPFWPWIRHVYHLAGRLAIDHPARLAVTLRLGDLAAADGDLPPSAQGAVKGPGGYWPTAFINPLSDLTGLPGMGVDSTLRATSPWLKLAAAAGLGQDWNRAGMPITAGTAGTGATDWYGRDTARPLWKDPLGVAYQTSKIFPLTREAVNLTLGNHPRYATGRVITDRAGKPIATQPAWTTLPRLFGIPQPVPVADVVAQQATRARRLRTRKAKGG